MNDLLDIFREEVDGNLKEATRLALAFEHSPPNRVETEDMMRVFHTLKGAARAIGFDQEREIAHRLEDIYHDLLDGKAEFRPDAVDLSLLAIDLIRDTLAARLAETGLPETERFGTLVDAYRTGHPLGAAARAEAPPQPASPAPPSPPTAAADVPAGEGMEDFSLGGALDLMAIFEGEVVSQIADARHLLVGFDPRFATEAEQEDLRRVFHTLKGAARALGCDPVRLLAGAIEDLLRSTHEGAPAAGPALAEVAECGLRWIEAVLAGILAGAEAPTVAPFLEQIEGYRQTGVAGPCAPPASGQAQAQAQAQAEVAESVPMPQPTPQPIPQPVPEPPSAAAPEVISGRPRVPEPSRTPQSGPGSGAQGSTAPHRARLAYEQLDRLHRLSGELTVAVGSLSGQRNQLRGLTRDLTRAGQQLSRVVTTALTEDLDREALHEALRLGVERLFATAGRLEGLTDIHDRMEGRLHNLADGLGDEVTQARLVPLSDLLDDYPRMVRDLAHELGKRVELRLDGEDNRIDRAVLEQLRNPLLHLLRNAIDHGIEPPATRLAQGKPEVGRLAIEARQLGSMMRIRVLDDGAGIDLDRLEAAVIAAGHTTAEFWGQMGLEERMQFLFLPGLSTARAVSSTSGRGFGLDIVKAGIEASGGTVGVHSEPGRATCFELRVPLSLSLTRCLLVIGGRHPLFGEQRYAFPMSEVARVRRLVPDELRELEGRLAVRLDDETLPLFQLHAILGLGALHQDLKHKHLLVLGEGEARFGLLVEAVVDEFDMVARPIDERLGKVAEVSGLTLLDDGGLALIVDVPDLLLRMREGAGYLPSGLGQSGLLGPAPEEETVSAPQILVVEDSVTVREVERHFLEQAGYQVTTAVNGMDGLNKAKAGEHRILITDIDMPRMNGIELIRTLRGMDRFRQIPIIVVSYKDRAEDRDKAMEAGADRYVTKSEFDTDAMLALVAQLLADPGARTA